MLDLTGTHDSQTCNLDANNQPCEACAWATSVEEERGYAEWSLEAELNGFAAQFGPEALGQQIDRYMAARRLF